ncbi:hypothetical protein SteCoe_2072 [Stentor coeruleus]|uniref:EF-hand domain-containing protein n=1 Tax=Stentor coeruleus TaxID=5963 RepID=A0A1R2D0D4_9CILI|nr:hypothetical protein SteCoe_2072 [Stentor coeruleus]
MRVIWKAFIIGFLVVNSGFGIWLFFKLESQSFDTVRKSFIHKEVNMTDIKNSQAWEEYMVYNRFDQDHENVVDDKDYCVLVKEYRAQHKPLLDYRGMPLPMERLIFSDYMPGNLVKDVINNYATLVYKYHYLDVSADFPKEKIPYYVNMFFHKTPYWHYYHELGTEFLCPGQMYNHIPGHEHMINKDDSAKAARIYGKKYENRKDCFYQWSFMPLTIDLSAEGECKLFFKHIEDRKFQGIEWIMKKSRNSHNGEGVILLTKSKLRGLKVMYKHGKKCGEINDKFIVQKYIGNPLTVEGKKFDFRVYMLIASVDPLIILYHDGFLRVSLTQYDVSSEESGSHITNTHQALEFVKTLNTTEDERDEMMKEQMWSFEKFEDYMIKQGKVKMNWLNDYVRPLMKKKMYHLVQMHIPNLIKHPGVFEMYGLDYIFDDDLNLWLLEVNRSPAMQATTEEKGKLQGTMIKDILDIEYAILYGIELDPIVENTTFNMIFDDRKHGMDKYYGLIDSECV